MVVAAGGGISLIRVSDNGSGMDADDLGLPVGLVAQAVLLLVAPPRAHLGEAGPRGTGHLADLLHEDA